MSDPTPRDDALVDRLKSEGPSPHAGDDPAPAEGPEPDDELTARLKSEGPSPHAGDDGPKG